MAKKASSASSAAGTAAAGTAPMKNLEEEIKAATTSAETPQVGPMRLEDAILALQKTFSRVNELTQANRMDHSQKPTAVITGQVQFTLNAQVAPATDKSQTFNVALGGPMSVTLQGMIDTDVKVHDAFTPPQPPRQNG